LEPDQLQAQSLQPSKLFVANRGYWWTAVE
jgi:hypothetical protein